MNPKDLLPLDFRTRIGVMLPIVFTAFSLFAAEPVSPQNSANLDAQRDTTYKNRFLTDTNRSFPMLFIVGDSTVHNPQKT